MELEDLTDSEWRDIFKRVGETAKREAFALNLPIYYMDDNGDLVAKYKDGTIQIIQEKIGRSKIEISKDKRKFRLD